MDADVVIVGAGSAGCAMAFRLAEAGVQAPVGMESNSMLALAGMVAAGDWASIVADEVARVLTGDGLVAVPIAEAEGRIGYMVGLIAPARDPALPAVAGLWEVARAVGALGKGRRAARRQGSPPDTATPAASG